MTMAKAIPEILRSEFSCCGLLVYEVEMQKSFGLLTWFISNNIVGNVAAPYCVNEIGVVLSCS